MLHIFEKECVKQSSNQLKVSDLDLLPKKMWHIYNRVDEMARLLEEERLLQEQKRTEEQDQKLKEPVKRVRQEWPSKKYWRWPSMDRIKDLKQRMDLGIIPEVESGMESDMMSTAARSFPRDSTRNVTPDQGQAATESEVEPRLIWGDRPSSGSSTEPLKMETFTFNASNLRATDQPEHQESRQEPSGTDKSPAPKRKMFRRKISKRTSERSVDAQKGYSRLSESDTSSSDRDLLHLSPVHQGIIERRHSQILSPRPTDESQNEVRTKLVSLESRLVNLEQSTKSSLNNIETLLRNAIFQRGQYMTAPVPQMQSQTLPILSPETTMHMTVPTTPIPPPGQVPVDVEPTTTFQSTDGTSYPLYDTMEPTWTQPTVHHRPHSSPFSALKRPRSAGPPGQNITLIPPDLPPTHPPMRAFQSFHDV